MKVLYKGKPYKVYGVSPSPYTQGYYYEKGADFLIYIKNSWVWVSSDYCIPYKKKILTERKQKILDIDTYLEMFRYLHLQIVLMMKKK